MVPVSIGPLSPFYPPSLGLGQVFPLTLRFGHWYIAAECSHCKTLTCLFPDVSEGLSQLSGSYFMRCPRCKELGNYDVQHYRHRERRKPRLHLQIL